MPAPTTTGRAGAGRPRVARAGDLSRYVRYGHADPGEFGLVIDQADAEPSAAAHSSCCGALVCWPPRAREGGPHPLYGSRSLRAPRGPPAGLDALIAPFWVSTSQRRREDAGG